MVVASLNQLLWRPCDHKGMPKGKFQDQMYIRATLIDNEQIKNKDRLVAGLISIHLDHIINRCIYDLTDLPDASSASPRPSPSRIK